MRWAKAALIPRRIIRQRRRNVIANGDPLTARYELFGGVLIVAHSLGIQPIIILANRHIKCAINQQAVHIDLHLRPVLRLRFLDAIFIQLVKTLFVCRLKFCNMTLRRRFRDAAFDDRIGAP